MRRKEKERERKKEKKKQKQKKLKYLLYNVYKLFMVLGGSNVGWPQHRRVRGHLHHDCNLGGRGLHQRDGRDHLHAGSRLVSGSTGLCTQFGSG